MELTDIRRATDHQQGDHNGGFDRLRAAGGAIRRDVCPRPRTRSVQADERRQRILAVAVDCFLKTGFAGTSMSAIAAALGGSKATLYAHFNSKADLFQAILRSFGAAESLQLETLCVSRPIQEVLVELGRQIVRGIGDDQTIGIYRLVIAESGRFPELGRRFLENGPDRLAASVARFLEARIAEGRLCAADAGLASEQLIALLRSGPLYRRLCGSNETQTAASIDVHVRRAVGTFLAGVGSLDDF